MGKIKSTNLLALFFGLFSGVAGAHPGHSLESAYAGFMHPLTGWDHLLVMLALGVWASQLGQSWRWKLPATFLIFMLIGMLASTYGFHFAGIETGIAASVMAMGLLLILTTRLPTTARVFITAIFATMHGMAHGTELVGYQSIFVSAGMLLTTFLLHIAGLWLGSQHTSAIQQLKNLTAWSMLFLGAYWVVT